jgi:hypothetical protein
MNKIITLLFIIILLNPCSLFSQRKKWKSFRWEVLYGGGASYFYGDLGGSSTKVHNFITDMNIRATRAVGMVAARWKFKEDVAIRFTLSLAQMFGNDAFSHNPATVSRNLNFRSRLIEQSVQIEYSVIKQKYGLAYSFSNMKRFSFKNVNTYFFMGFGGFYFNPEIKIAGKWIPPNGQSKFGTGKPYNFYAVSFPVGIGFKYGLNRRINMGLEISNRWTTTDYIDNQSDKNSKRNDSYSFLVVYFEYKVKTTKKGLPKLDFLKKIKFI